MHENKVVCGPDKINTYEDSETDATTGAPLSFININGHLSWIRSCNRS
ncbi:hypothetical protein ACFL2Q_04590 [Thermodesulfobacteriota bacterium]